VEVKSIGDGAGVAFAAAEERATTSTQTQLRKQIGRLHARRRPCVWSCVKAVGHCVAPLAQAHQQQLNTSAVAARDFLGLQRRVQTVGHPHS
jgi:hypothetical protein